jgi:hypothetical protein
LIRLSNSGAAAAASGKAAPRTFSINPENGKLISRFLRVLGFAVALDFDFQLPTYQLTQLPNFLSPLLLVLDSHYSCTFVAQLVLISDHRITRSPDHPILTYVNLRSSAKICG